MEDKTQETVSRRSFFGKAGKGLALGVGAAVTVTAGAEAAEEAPAKGSYRETAHIKTYYASTRF